MKKIKIYIFSPYSTIGGDTLSLSRLIDNLSEKKYDISFISLRKSKISEYNLSRKVKFINLRTSRTILSIFKIRNLIKSDLNRKYSKYIFISNQNFGNIVSIFIVKGFKKIKLILIERNHLDEFKYQKLFKNFFIKHLIKIFYKHADLIIGISKKLSKDLSIYVKKKVVTIYNPAFDKKILKLSRQRVNFLPKNNLILSVGRFENQKDPFTLLKAFKIVSKKIDTSLLMIGYGSMLNKINEYIKNNSLSNKVTILKNVKNAYPYYKFSSIFVVTSKYEGFCNVIVEAAMFKVPIISSKCNSGPSEILMNGKGGDFFKIGDYKKLSKIIIKRLKYKNKTKTKILKKNLNRFSVEKNVNKYKKIFKQLV